MTPISIPEIHGRNNPHYSSILSIFGRCRCHGGELWGLCQLLVHPIAHQHGISARQLRAFEVALRVPHSVLQDEAVRLQICLLQQADPVFFPWIYSAYGKYVPKGCWHTIGVTLGVLFPPLASRRRCHHWAEASIQNRQLCRSPRTLLASGAEVLWRAPEAAGVADAMIEVEKGTLRALKHTAARQGRRDLIA
jgi:hypothetical protein